MPALIGAGVAAAASVINNTVTNLMNKPLQKAQIASLNLQGRLSQLSNAQQSALAIQLQNAQTADEQMQILTNAAAQVESAGVTGNATILSAAVTNQATNNMATAGIIIASLVVLVAGIYFLNKKD